MSALRHVFLLLKKDLNVELRRGQEILVIFIFPLAVIAGLSFVIATMQLTELLVYHLIWPLMLFEAVFLTTTIFTREEEKGTMNGIRLLPCSSAVVCIAKSLYAFIFTLLTSIEALILLTFFARLQPPPTPTYYVIVLVAINIALISTFSSALTMHSEGKSIVIPFIVTFFSIPSLSLGAVGLQKTLLNMAIGNELKILVAFTLIIALVDGSLMSLEVKED